MFKVVYGQHGHAVNICLIPIVSFWNLFSSNLVIFKLPCVSIRHGLHFSFVLELCFILLRIDQQEIFKNLFFYNIFVFKIKSTRITLYDCVLIIIVLKLCFLNNFFVEGLCNFNLVFLSPFPTLNMRKIKTHNERWLRFQVSSTLTFHPWLFLISGFLLIIFVLTIQYIMYCLCICICYHEQKSIFVIISATTKSWKQL